MTSYSPMWTIEKQRQCNKKWYRNNTQKATHGITKRRKRNRRHLARIQFEYNINKEFHLTLHDYALLLVKQEFKCCICTFIFTFGTYRATPHIDHDHITGRVRGLLCCRCNTFLGKYETNINLMGNLTRYLNESNGKS